MSLLPPRQVETAAARNETDSATVLSSGGAIPETIPPTKAPASATAGTLIYFAEARAGGAVRRRAARQARLRQGFGGPAGMLFLGFSLGGKLPAGLLDDESAGQPIEVVLILGQPRLGARQAQEVGEVLRIVSDDAMVDG